MKRHFYIISAFLCAVFAANSCRQDDVDDLWDQVNAISDYDVSTISEQIIAIETSIASLETMCEYFDSYVTTLKSQASALETSIAETKANAAAVLEELEALQDGGDGALADTATALRAQLALDKAEVLAALAELQSDLEGELETINSTISSLESKWSDFDSRISTLEGLVTTLYSYIDSSVSNSKDSLTAWSEATFLTLEQYYLLSDSVAVCSVQIEALNSSITGLADSLSAVLTEEIQDCIDDIVATYVNSGVDETIASALSDAVDKLTEGYTSALSTAKDEITSAYEAKIASAIETLETSLTEWVSEQLGGYYTIAQTEAKLSALKDSIENQLEAQAAYILTLIEALDEDAEANAEILTAMQEKYDSLAEMTEAADLALEQLKEDVTNLKEDITEEYTAAVDEAITELEGTLSDEIDALNSSIESELSEIESQISELEETLSDLDTRLSAIEAAIAQAEEDLASLLARIQSISYVPEYSDGGAGVRYSYDESGTIVVNDSLLLNFKIRPTDCATTVAESWESVLSSNVVYTETRAVETEEMEIKSVSADEDGVLSVLLSASGLSNSFLSGSVGASVCIEISDGNNSLSSQYVPVELVYDGEVVEEDDDDDDDDDGSTLTINSSWSVAYYGKDYYDDYEQYYDGIAYYIGSSSSSTFLYTYVTDSYFDEIGIDSLYVLMQDSYDYYSDYYDSKYYSGYYYSNAVSTRSTLYLTNLELGQAYYGIMFGIDSDGVLTGEYQISASFTPATVSGSSDAYNAWVGTWEYTDDDGETGELIFIERSVNESYAFYVTSQSFPAVEVAFSSTDGSVTFSSVTDLLGETVTLTDGDDEYSCVYMFVPLYVANDTTYFVTKNEASYEIATGSMSDSGSSATIAGKNFFVESRTIYVDATGMGYVLYDSDYNKIYTLTYAPPIALPCTLGVEVNDVAVVTSLSSAASAPSGYRHDYLTDLLFYLDDGTSVVRPSRFSVSNALTISKDVYRVYTPSL